MSIELEYGNKKFKCPHCSILSHQDWFTSNNVSDTVKMFYNNKFLDYRSRIHDTTQEALKRFLKYVNGTIDNDLYGLFPQELSISICHSCNNFSLWIDRKIIYPKSITVPNPNQDMEEDIQNLYFEAAEILTSSPKGAAALLRLALQKLLIQLGEKGNNINADIGNLVSKGLSPKVQQALDLVRVIGNESVHPGTIDLDDNLDIATTLFKLLNFITEEMITKPKEIDNMFHDILPDSKKEAIAKRDSN